MAEILDPPEVLDETLMAAPFHAAGAPDASGEPDASGVSPVVVGTQRIGTPEAVAEGLESPPLEMGTLETTALRATLWTVVSYGASQALRLCNSLVLTRLLVPAAFGQMTLVMTLIVGITLLSDIGLGPSIIQSTRGDDKRFLNTAWTLQVFRGVALWLAALLLAWPASRFYHDRTMLGVFPILALGMLVGGFNSTNLMTLERHMGARRLFAIEFSTQIVALVVTVAWAFYYPSVWALVGGNLISNLYRLALSHSRLVPGIRNRFLWDRESLNDILHFGKWIFLGTAFYFFASQADRLILGRCVSMSVLGVYGIAFALSDIPRAVIGAFSQRVGYPFIAKIVHLPVDEFRTQYLRYRMYALLVGATLLTMMVVWGDQLVLRLYKPSYAAAAWMVPILAAGLWHTLLYQTTSPVLFSLGKSKYNAVGNAVYCATMLTGIPLAFHFFGLTGAVIAVAAGDFPLYLVFLFGAQRERVRTLKQDLQMTAVFLTILGLSFALRHAFK